MDAGGICASPLWNETISWDTRDPYLSECFKHLVLVIGSCAVLWVVAPFEFIKIGRYRGSPHPWTTISIAKIACKAILLLICIVELIKEIYAYAAHVKLGLDGLIAAVAYLVTIILTVILTMMCKKRGLRSSIALPSFWMISTVATLISIYDDIHAYDAKNWVSLVSLVDDSAVFVISVVQLILSNIVEKGTSPYGRQIMDSCPLDECSFVSRLTLSWFLRLLIDSTKRSLHHDDLISLCSEFRSTYVAKRFCEIWNKTCRDNMNSSRESITQNLQHGQLYSQTTEERASFSSPEKRSLLAALSKVSAHYIAVSSVFELLYTALYFLPIYILSLILDDTEEPKWHKYLFSIALFVVLLLCTLIDSQRKYYGLASAFRVKTAVLNAIFEKALVSQGLQNVEKHLQDDAENIFQMVSLLSEVWGTTLRILIGLYLLWLFLGSASFIGGGTAALFIPVTVLISNTASYFRTKAFDVKSEWWNVLSECLRGMRSLKLYVWEEYFLRKLKTRRQLEISKMRKTLLLKVVYKLVILSSTSVVSLAAFSVFVVMGNSFDLKEVFLAFATIYLLKAPFINILRLLAYLVQGLASISKVETFLEAKEVQILSPSNISSRCGLCLENAKFAWNTGDTCQLSNLTFTIQDGSLIAVVGESLSGKSSLLRSLMGEMEKVEGTANVKGEISFVSDNSWIQNTTLEENVLFSRLKVDSIYRNTLRACELLPEIENLPQGEETEIGEKGYPLSDDQKLKVDLARAVYQNADIYLLDDLFRRTDSSTAEQLFQKVVGPTGVLQNKIRIFTTNSTEFLSVVDHIIFLKDGNLVEQGSYSDLVTKNGNFVEYLQTRTQTTFCVKNEKILSTSKKEFSFETFKYQHDPWYSSTGLSLKAESENFMQGEIMTAPRAFLRKVVNYIRMNGYLFIIPSILLAAIANCCEVASVTWFTWRSSDYEKKSKIREDLYIYAGIVLSQMLFCLICGIILSCGSILALRKMYNWLLNRIMRASLTTFGTTFVKRILQSFDKDLHLADEEIPIEFFEWLVMLLKAPVILTVTFVNFPILLLFFLPLAVAFIIIQKLYMNAWRQFHHLSTSTRCPLFNLLQNVFQGISNIRASNASLSFVSRFHTKQDNFNKCNFLFLLVSRWLSSSIEIIGCFFVLFTTLIVISENGQGSFLTGLLIVLAMQIPESLIAFTYLSSVLDIDLSCLERLQSFSHVKQEEEWENQLPHRWPTSGSIAIENMTTVYAEDLYPVLNNINITIQPGEKVAIIGKEDSGISTLLDSLFRLREICEGEIFIDNVDITRTGLHNLRSKLAIIPQDPLVFKGTLRENLDPEQNYRDEVLQLIVKTVGLGSNMTDLGNFIDNTLSIQEKYKIALARGKLKMSKIVIMEGCENTVTGEEYFQNCTFVLFGNSCALDNYDRIIRISSGETVEEI